MYKTIPLTLVLLAVPVVAQVKGSINRDAPTVTRSIQFKNSGALTVKYTAIHFGEGAWRGIIKNTGSHERFNKGAENRPIGSIKTTVVATASGREIPVGNYDLFFTVNERSGFILNLKNKGDSEAKSIRWRMAMTETMTKNTRFDISLNPGAKAGSCSITIAFGQKSVTVPLKLGAKKEDKKEGK